MTNHKRRVLITGAAGGMGRACARLFGTTDALILTDVAAAPLARLAAELGDEGYDVVDARAGDLGDPALLAALAEHLPAGAPFAAIHTAGLSPALAGWETIMTVNLIATARLLDMLEARLSPGAVAVLIASSAAHMMSRPEGAAPLLADPLADDFLDRIGGIVSAVHAANPVAGAGGVAYALSKQGVIDLVERRCTGWGRQGARIVSISPGMILTAMGRREMAETAGAAELAAATPAGRSGTAIDIALAARFLAGPSAGFITGCDLKVDGGGVAAMGRMMG